mmetsp:Transcript_1258/g.2756  ORF Transcript_1258/g.2756 Transcript_1258/m.2756 type:complete len:352 (-) Transcript_1258:108-1163(-)
MKDSVISILEGTLQAKGTQEKIKVKELRKLVFLSLQKDEDDKVSKKEYKKAIQALEKESKLALDADGLISLCGKASKKDKKKKSKKRKRKENDDDDEEEKNTAKKPTLDETNDDDDDDDDPDATPNNDIDEKEDDQPTGADSENKNKACKGNPQGVTRLFVGNLPFVVDETSLKTFLPGVTHIKWITDKETGKFYGSSFVEMDTSTSAADAVAKAGKELMGRAIKVNFAPARPGDVWPPPNKRTVAGGENSGGGGGQAGGTGVKAMSAKPDNCLKLFIGNLSYDIDEDGITKFFASVDVEIKAVRWLHHKDSGDFKGCGFVEFWKPEDCSKGATLNGKNLLGRPIRIDWSD